MDDYWTEFKKIIIKQKDLGSISFANITGTGISAIFWLYLASVIEPTQYGEIHYFIAIATFAQIISLIGTAEVLTIYTAKKIKIQTTLFFISILIAVASVIIIITIFSVLTLAFLFWVMLYLK